MSAVDGDTRQLELGYQWLEYDKIDVMTCQFLYKYDSKVGKIKVLNDSTRYTVSEMQWNLLEEHNIYSFKLFDKYSVAISEDSFTKEQ